MASVCSSSFRRVFQLLHGCCRKETVMLQKVAFYLNFFKNVKKILIFLRMQKRIQIEIHFDFPLSDWKVYKRRLDASFGNILMEALLIFTNRLFPTIWSRTSFFVSGTALFSSCQCEIISL